MVTKSELLLKLNAIDKLFLDHLDDVSPNKKDLDEIEKFSLDNILQEKKAVLGLDIYKYSSFTGEKQNLIPFVFDIIKDEATKHVKEVEPTLFGGEYELKFISTGDGGFLIFDTPLHA